MEVIAKYNRIEEKLIEFRFKEEADEMASSLSGLKSSQEASHNMHSSNYSNSLKTKNNNITAEYDEQMTLEGSIEMVEIN